MKSSQTKLVTVYANSYLELKAKYPQSFARRPQRKGGLAYQGLIEVKSCNPAHITR